MSDEWDEGSKEERGGRRVAVGPILWLMNLGVADLMQFLREEESPSPRPSLTPNTWNGDLGIDCAYGCP